MLRLSTLLVAGVLAAVVSLTVLAPILWMGMVSLLGIGIAALPPVVALIAWAFKTENLPRLFRPWWRWLGGLSVWIGALTLASLFFPNGTDWWGVDMGEVSFGGLLGQLILGPQRVEGALRGLGLIFLGVVMGMPKDTLRAAGRLKAYLVSFYRRGVLQRFLSRVLMMFVTAARVAVKKVANKGSSLGVTLPQPPPPFRRKRKSEGPVVMTNGLDDYEFAEALESDIDPEENLVTPSQPSKPFHTGPARAAARWDLPNSELLDKKEIEAGLEDHVERARLIEEALASYGVNCKVVQVQVGPAVTQYGVEPGWYVKVREVKERDEFGRIKVDKNGMPKVSQEEVSRTRVKVERITSLANDLALALAAPSVRIEAPVPGRRVVGIEVPNSTPGLVTLRGVIESPSFQRIKAKSKVAIALGKGTAGEPVSADLTKMPHLLIAGATGSGKSVCINSIITCLLMHASPEEVRLLMIDPKRVELVNYNEVPHLLAPVIVDVEKVLGTLAWVLKEMDERYKRFAEMKVRNIEGYNKHAEVQEPMPYWVLIIDELADLMMVAPYEVERAICRLAQLARATGIHLIIATQRPSVDVVTGLIKANFPTRISFAVVSQVDSRTILDMVGAEKLLGRGDMLYMPQDAAKPKRVQGVFVSDQEIERVVNYWASDKWRYMRPPQYGEELEKAAAVHKIGHDSETDPLFERAMALAAEHTRISTSLLQRKLRIGYPRAARIMEQLEDEGLVPGE